MRATNLSAAYAYCHVLPSVNKVINQSIKLLVPLRLLLGTHSSSSDSFLVAF